MSDTTAKIAAKGCASTGITEELAEKFYNQLGKKMIAIVEISSHSRQLNEDGKQSVNLQLLTVEPATTPEAEDYLRSVQRAQWALRNADSQQLAIDATLDDLEPKVEDVLRNRAMIHHYYQPADDDTDPEVCEVCGNTLEHVLHGTPPGDPFTTPDGGDDE